MKRLRLSSKRFWIGWGKISEESLAAGFKHSALLVVIAIVVSKVVPMIM